jgi:hypothetical protein
MQNSVLVSCKCLQVDLCEVIYQAVKAKKQTWHVLLFNNRMLLSIHRVLQRKRVQHGLRVAENFTQEAIDSALSSIACL